MQNYVHDNISTTDTKYHFSTKDYFVTLKGCYYSTIIEDLLMYVSFYHDIKGAAFHPHQFISALKLYAYKGSLEIQK